MSCSLAVLQNLSCFYLNIRIKAVIRRIFLSASFSKSGQFKAFFSKKMRIKKLVQPEPLLQFVLLPLPQRFFFVPVYVPFFHC